MTFARRLKSSLTLIVVTISAGAPTFAEDDVSCTWLLGNPDDVDLRSTLSHRVPDDVVLTCGTSRSIAGATEQHCFATFPYRSDEAGENFTRLSDELQGCLALGESYLEDSPVNHPDSFVQRLFFFGETSVSLSIKDKAANSETLVFVKMSPAPPQK